MDYFSLFLVLFVSVHKCLTVKLFQLLSIARSGTQKNAEKPNTGFCLFVLSPNFMYNCFFDKKKFVEDKLFFCQPIFE